MLTKQYLTGGSASFVIEVPSSAVIAAVQRGEPVGNWLSHFSYRIRRESFDQGRRYSYFVDAHDQARGWLYLGVYNDYTNEISVTRAGKFDANLPVVRILRRVVKAYLEGRGCEVDKAGYKVVDAKEAKGQGAGGESAAPVCPVDHHVRALRFLADTFTVAIGYGLKRPMIRLHFKDRRFKFYLSRRGTVCLKTGRLVDNAEKGCRDPEGDEEYAGCLLRGKFKVAQIGDWNQPNRPERPLSETEKEFLERLVANPTGFIAECGKDMGRCCYCNQPLEDARSKAVGYGRTCAKRWGLPWGDEKATESAPSFAKCYDDDAAAMLYKMRDDLVKGETTAWLVFADWLQEHGLPPCEAPEAGVVLPRND